MDQLEPNLKDYDPAGLRALLDAALVTRTRVNRSLVRIRAEIRRRERAAN